MPRDMGPIEGVRVSIDGNWTADEMALFLRACDDLYNLHVFISTDIPGRVRFFSDGPFDYALRRHPWMFLLGLPDVAESNEFRRGDYLTRVSAVLRTVPFHEEFLSPLRVLPLSVRRVQYGSEGFKDLLGLGEAIKQLKEIVFGIVDYCLTYRKRVAEIEKTQLDNEEHRKKIEQLEIDNRKRRVELVEQQVRVLKDLGVPKAAIRQALLGVDERADVIESLAMKGKIKGITNLSEQEQK
jgi:hypothetical protein